MKSFVSVVYSEKHVDSSKFEEIIVNSFKNSFLDEFPLGMKLIKQHKFWNFEIVRFAFNMGYLVRINIDSKKYNCPISFHISTGEMKKYEYYTFDQAPQ